MPMFIKNRPVEGGTIIIECKFVDENKNVLSASKIKTVHWWLTNTKNEIINGKDNVNIETINNPLNIVLTGNDLPVDKLTFTIKATYNSIYGTDLNLVDSISFYVQSLNYNI